MEWEEVNPEDPELYIAYCNYYFCTARREVISFEKQGSQSSYIVIRNPKTGELIAGLFFSDIYYDEEKIDLAFKYLDEGIKKYPDRLDMHFCKIHILGEVERYEVQKNAILDVLGISKEINNNWLWLDGEVIDDAFTFMMENIHNYIYHYFNNYISNGYMYIIEISQKIIEIYPELVFPYNNIAVVYCYQDNCQEAINYFKLAEEKNPTDTIVISNIASLLSITGDIDASLEYYEKLIQYGNEEEREYAEQQIRELKNEE